MTFQIRDKKGDIVDKDLSYEEALMWIDQQFGNCFIMEPMKEDDRE